LNRTRPVTTQLDCRTSPRRVAIYASNADLRLRANQRMAMQRFADAMGWVTTVEEGTRRLLDGAADHAFDLVLCWRFDELRNAESLLERLSAHGVEMLAVAQSCTALME
jgi:hypothetical protein